MVLPLKANLLSVCVEAARVGSEQSQIAGQCKGIRPPYEHGTGERARNVDRDAKKRQRQARQTLEQGALHSEALPAGRLSHHRDQES